MITDPNTKSPHRDFESDRNKVLPFATLVPEARPHPQLVDTHTHIYLPEFDDDRDEVVRRAVLAGVGMMILPAIDAASIDSMDALHNRYPDITAMAMGLHPTELTDNWADRLDAVEALLRSRRDDFVAVGEIGMDLYWDKSMREQQREVFRRQCGLAVELDMPVIIHCREALDDTLDILGSLERVPRGVFHSFTGTPGDIERVRAVGDFYFGINGVVTFKNCPLRNHLNEIGLDRILLETDAPYLAPVPKRGKRNEPAYVAFTAAHVAESLGTDVAALAEATSRNARRLFALR